jgi:VanZ family protein
MGLGGAQRRERCEHVGFYFLLGILVLFFAHVDRLVFCVLVSNPCSTISVT